MSSLARIRFTCIHCNQKLSVLPAAAGRTLPCRNPQCGKPVTVPPPDAIDTAQPAGPAMPANVPTGAAITPASKPGAMVMIAAALAMLSLGAALGFFLIRPHGNPRPLAVQVGEKAAQTAVKALADGDHDQQATVNSAPRTKATASEASSAESQRKPAVAKQQKSKEAQIEKAARKQRDKTRSEYAVLARTQSFEHYHNDRRVMPSTYDMPRISQLTHSDNADIRNAASSIIKAQAMIESHSKNALNPKDQYLRTVTSAPDRNLAKERLGALRGDPVMTDQEELSQGVKSGMAMYRNVQQQRMAAQSIQTALDGLAEERKRITYKIAKELAGPYEPAAIQLKVQAFVRGENVFRVSKDSPKATYCITATNGGKKLTHCTIAVIVRGKAATDGIRPDLGPPFDLDEITNAVLQPSSTDKVALYYIGELGSRDKIHFLDLPAQVVRDNLERVGVVMFSDQMTVACDPNPGFQEVRDDQLSQAGSDVGNPSTPLDKTPAKKMPTSRRPAGLQSSKRAKGNGAPRRN